MVTGRCVGDTTCYRTCTGCIPFDEGEFYLREIRNDEVEHELAYATSGSIIPANLHGIWWMDQSGFGLDAVEDGYPYSMGPSCEVLLTFGDDAVWQQETGCVTPVPFYGGTQGHWTAYNAECGRSLWDQFVKTKLTLSFCFTDVAQEHIDIYSKIRPWPTVIRPLLRVLGFQDAGDGYLFVPHGLFKMSMNKRSWGWDRETHITGSWTRDRDVLSEIEAATPGFLWSGLEWALSYAKAAQHYPVFQIVDGDGQRTVHYETYLRRMATHPRSGGQATQLASTRRADGW